MLRDDCPHILVTGSRSFDVITATSRLESLFAETARFDPMTVFVFGDAIGVDTAARMLARKYRLPYLELGPAWAARGDRAALLRNTWMVELLPPALSRVVAVWDGVSGGTAQTMREARARGFDVELLHG